MKDRASWFLKILFQETQTNNGSVTYVVKISINLHEYSSL